MENIRKENERLRYELIEFIDYLSPTGGQTILNLRDKIAAEVRISPLATPQTVIGMYLLWLSELEERGLLYVILPQENKQLADQGVFHINVTQPKLHEYLDELYRKSKLRIENLDLETLQVVLEIGKEIEHELRVTIGNSVDIKLVPSSLRPKAIEPYPEHRERALRFLRSYGAIKSYEIKDHWNIISITLERRLFDLTLIRVREYHRKAIDVIRARATEATVIKKERPVPSQTKAKPEPPLIKPSFDPKLSEIRLGNKTCPIPDETLMYYLCKLVFKKRRAAILETDIIEEAGSSHESKRSVYDAHQRVNKCARDELGIEKLFEFRAGKVRLVQKYR